MARSRFGNSRIYQVFQAIRWVGFLLALLLTTVWAYHTYDQLIFGATDNQRKAQNAIEQLAARMAKTDPELAEKIRKAAKSLSDKSVNLNSSGQIEGLAVALIYQQKIGNEKGIADLASQLDLESPLVELLGLAMDKEDFPDEKSRNEFLLNHGAVLALAADKEILTERSQAQLLVRGQIQRIERARKTKDWPKLKYDALSVWILDGVENQELRSYYLENLEWLGPALAEFHKKNSGDEAVKREPGDWEELIAVARKYHPLTREAVTGSQNSEIPEESEGAGSHGLAMFIDHGEVIKECANKGVPVLETVAILYANPGWMDNASDGEKATKLVEIQRNRKSVWGMAMAAPQILELDEKVPKYSDKLIQNHGHDDIAPFILNVCQGYEEPAAQAIVKYDDTAIYALNKYQNIDQFRAAMKERDGFRAPAFMMLKGNIGLNRVGNPADVDKDFTPLGDPAGGWGWKDVPILGGPVNVVRNWVNGATNEWSDLGWAALDAADGALLVATFGGSTLMTAGKQATKGVAKKAVLMSAKATAKKIAIDGAESALKTAGKGSRNAAKEAFLKAPSLGFKGSMLARMGGTGLTMKLAQISRVTYQGSKYVINGMAKVVNFAFKRTKGAYNSLSPAAKRAIRNSLLVLSLSYTISERTFPAIKEMIKDGIGPIADYFFKPIENLVNSIDSSIKAIESMAGFSTGILLNLVVLFALAFATFQLFPIRIAFKHI